MMAKMVLSVVKLKSIDSLVSVMWGCGYFVAGERGGKSVREIVLCRRSWELVAIVVERLYCLIMDSVKSTI